MMKLIFSRSADYEDEGPHAGEEISLSFDVTGEEAWPEYVDKFERFLLACGYIPHILNKFVEPIEIES